jgi:hypothetical protein
MNNPKPVIHDVVAMLAQQHPEEFADFWAKPPDQQSELIERYGTESDRGLWDKRNADPAKAPAPKISPGFKLGRLPPDR